MESTGLRLYDGGMERVGADGARVAAAEDEAAFEALSHTAMEVPVDLVPKIRELIAKRRRTA